MISRTNLDGSLRIGVLAILLALLLTSTTIVFGVQNAPEPRREELLNGLRVLIWSQPASPNVTIALRIHSGAAFDLMGKGGTMALLGDQLFPDPETREFFVDELGGSLLVTVDYDSLNIRMTGRASEFERMLEILRTALISTPITVPTVARLREARIKMSREMGASPSFIADRAIAKRLYGDYPYGRPVGGTPDTLITVDRPDLLLARERFHTPDNGTIVVIGGVQESRALRALRQLLGAWRKSDKLVPSTFRMPDAPDPRTLIVDAPGADGVEVRLAVRSMSRSDRDYPVATLLTLLMRDRWQASFTDPGRSAFFVRNESYLLSGLFVMGASFKEIEAANVLESAKKTMRALVDSPPSTSELERVRSEALGILSKGSNDPATVAKMWLDAESYKLTFNGDQVQSLNKITAADVQRVAVRLFRDAPLAIVVVGNAAQLKSDLEYSGRVEVLGENQTSQPTRPPTPVKSP
jgi:zinc protease